MNRFQFGTWAAAYSQRTNRSLAGSRLVIDKRLLSPLDRLQAQLWGMTIEDAGSKASQDKPLLDVDATCPLCDVPDGRQLSGVEAMDFAQQHMPVLEAYMQEAIHQADFHDARIAACLILEPKTAVLLRKLKAAGATVGAYCGSEANDERVVRQLREEGITVVYDPSWSAVDSHQAALDMLDRIQPNIIIDDGASFARLAAMERPELMKHIIGVAEETTSGIRAFEAMQEAGALSFPVVAVNDSPLKTGFDNAHGTGETCITTLQRILGEDVFTGASVTVLGYGPVGSGFAHKVRALGADVTVCDTDPIVALQAVFDGFRALDITQAIQEADIVISATGVRHTVTLQDMQSMKDHAVLAVIGGIANEIALDTIPGFHAQPKTELRSLAIPGGNTIRLVSEGDGVNYTVGGGNPIEIMDLSFAVQAAAVTYLLSSKGHLPNGLQRLDHETNRNIAEIALKVRGYSVSHAVTDNGYDWKLTRFAENERR